MPGETELSNKSVRYTWYETDSVVVIDFFAKKCVRDSVKLSLDDKFNLQFSALSVIDNNESPVSSTIALAHTVSNTFQTKIVPSKVEVKLQKIQQSFWRKLERDSEEPLVESLVVEPTSQAKENSDNVIIGDSNIRHYPSSVKTHTDWDKIANDLYDKEIKDEKKEGDAALQELFSKIHHDGTDEQKRAMEKSFLESGGTVLSTNWDDVKKGKVEVKPPDGCEYKTFKSI